MPVRILSNCGRHGRAVSALPDPFMPKLLFKRHVSHTPEQMLALVADVGCYPEFVPNCTDMELGNLDGGDSFDARMHVRFGPLAQAYTSRVTVDRTDMTVTAVAKDGPFSHLESVWRFVPDEAGAEISFELDFNIANPLLAAAAGPAFAAKQGEIVDAFVDRARQIYG